MYRQWTEEKIEISDEEIINVIKNDTGEFHRPFNGGIDSWGIKIALLIQDSYRGEFRKRLKQMEKAGKIKRAKLIIKNMEVPSKNIYWTV
jgi:hypothetical protein